MNKNIIAHPNVIKAIRDALRGVRADDLQDAIATTQVQLLEALIDGRVDDSVKSCSALSHTIAERNLQRRNLQRAKRRRYDVGFCGDPDSFAPLDNYGRRERVDVRLGVEVLAGLLDADEMPEHGLLILDAEAAGTPHAKIAEEIGVTASAVRNRLFRMRALFRKRLGLLGLTLVLMIVFTVSSAAHLLAPKAPSGDSHLAHHAVTHPTRHPRPSCGEGYEDAGSPGGDPYRQLEAKPR